MHMHQQSWARWLSACLAVVLLVVAAGAAGKDLGCPCTKRQACNNCCHVEAPDGKVYGPHCRRGVCGAGDFPEDPKIVWTESSGPPLYVFVISAACAGETTSHLFSATSSLLFTDSFATFWQVGQILVLR